MATRDLEFVEGEYYHIYNRGNSKQLIFKNREDYKHFEELLYISNSTANFNLFDLKRANSFDIFLVDRGNNIVAIGAYCLMPNHFHILLTPLIEGGVSKFMQKLSTAYSMYFNRKYKRTGGLFEGKFKSEHIDNDRYLKYIFSYIHLNPIKLIQKDWKERGIIKKQEALDFITEYDFNSLGDFMKLRTDREILNLNFFPKYFPNKKSFFEEIIDWINYNKHCVRQDLTQSERS